MARYKAGDRVVVREDLVLHNAYWMLKEDGSRGDYRDTFVGDMKEFSGRVVEIRTFTGKYRIHGSTCNWTDEMFLGLEEEVFGSQVEIDPDALDAVLQ